MNNKEYITLYSTFAMLCYFQHNIAYPAYCSIYCCLDEFTPIYLCIDGRDTIDSFCSCSLGGS